MTEVYTRKLKLNGWAEEDINNLMTAYHNGEVDDNYIKENLIDTNEMSKEIKQEIKQENKNIVFPDFFNFLEKEIKENFIKAEFTQENYDDLKKFQLHDNNIQEFTNKFKDFKFVKSLKELLDNRKLEEVEGKKTEHLWQAQDEDPNVFAMHNSKISMHIMLTIFGKEIECLLDTGAMMNIISKKIIDDLKLDSFVDKSQKVEVVGVGENKTSGTIPYIHTYMKDSENHLFEVPLCFDVMEAKSMTKIILGLSFMTTYQVVLDFKSKCLNIGGRKVPFIMKSL